VELRDRVCVVTGGAGGIGAALSRAFVGEGAGHVVVADLDAAGARAVADALGEQASARAVDVSAGKEIEALVAGVEAEVGPIDLFASNAGITAPGGVEVPDATWERVWAVNVMAHVHAARALLPRMLARGGGHLLSTASAAGLLSQPGDAAYTATKHAAVGLAEWLAISYGDQGIGVSCLCPMAVDTAMLRGGLRGGLPAGDAPPPTTGAAGAAAVQGVLSAERVAEAVVEGLRDGRFLILPHPEVATFERRRAGDRDRWLAGMRRLTAALADGEIPQP
jgi:NAD(P)-dependent dehydrogenase (short-subunit alcohol dehydrogenase family)